MRQTELHMTDDDRALVDEIRCKGLHRAREINRAHVLSSLDRGVPEAQIMAEIEIGILSRQCLERRIESRHHLQSEVDAWQQARNAAQRIIEWTFTRQDADLKLGRYYVPIFSC